MVHQTAHDLFLVFWQIKLRFLLKYRSPHLREARKNRLQLRQHRSLISRARITLITGVPNANTRITTTGIHNRSLSGQSISPASRDIVGGKDRCTVDARQDKLELGRRRTSAAGDSRIVDVEPDAIGQVWRPRGEEGLRDVGGQVGVDGLVRLRGGGPGHLRASRAAEGDARDALKRRFSGRANSPGE